MKTQCALLIVLVTLIGCTVGPSVVTFSPATNPQGIHASRQLNSKAEIEGELLEVSDTALVVLAVDSLVLVPFRWIRIGRFYQAGHLQIRRGRFRRSPRRNSVADSL